MKRSSPTLLPPEIFLFGDDEGTAEAAKEFGLRYVPHVAKNEYGTPMLNDLFETAQNLATHNLLCHANADIILSAVSASHPDSSEVVTAWNICSSPC